MKRGEKRQKFHDALLQMLYPPPSPSQQEDKPESEDASSQSLNLYDIPDELDEDPGSTSSTDDDEEDGDDGPTKKLTRAQRKRLRKKKLKEAASRRRKIIGPLLPNASEDGIGEGDFVKEEPQGVRENAAEKDGIPRADKPGSKQNKLKQRRMVKKLASESRKPSSTGNSNEDTSFYDNGNA